MEDKSVFELRDEDIKSSIVRSSLKIRVEKVPFLVPFGDVEKFLKYALASKNNIEIFSCENTDLHLF